MRENPIILKEIPKKTLLTNLRLFFRILKTFRRGMHIPKLLVEIHSLKTDSKLLAQYKTLCQLKNEEHLPLLYPHVILGELHLYLFAHKNFPFGVIGLLHLRNHITQFKRIKTTDSFDAKLYFKEQRIRKQGLEFDLITEVSVNGEKVWESISTYLKRGHFGKEDPPSLLADCANIMENIEKSHEFSVPKNAAALYAKITGDNNPIHTSIFIAKLFGYQTSLIHAMWTVARILPMLDIDSEKITLNTAFKGPLYLGKNAELKIVKLDTSKHFEIFCEQNERPVIVGNIQY